MRPRRLLVARLPRRLPLLVTAALLLAGCGGGTGLPEVGLGTVALRNETDTGMAPLTVTGFFLVPSGSSVPSANLLHMDLPPGGVVILGLFPEGHYDAVAVLASGGQVVFTDQVVAANQPTNFVLPGN